MKPTTRELAAAQRLAESLIEFVVALEEGMTQRRASRPWEEIRVRVDPPAPQTPSPVSPQPEKPERTLLTSREVAGRLGISERTVWSITAPRGPLPTIRIGRRTMYSVSDLDILVERLKQKPRPRERTPFERANDRHL